MSGWTGSLRLARLAARRDRVTLTAWILGLGLLLMGMTALSAQVGASHADLVRETALMANTPAMRMLGLASGVSVGAYAMIRGFVTLAVLAALMSTLLVVRHTRQNEELGRAELLGATVVGRYAGLTAAVLIGIVTNVVLAVALGVAMIVTGQPAWGSITAGAAVAGVGVVFVGIAAVTSQLYSTTRGATGAASAVLGVAFLMSGIGNMLGTVPAGTLRVVSAWPVWLSPIGWGQQMRPFGGNHWWPLVVSMLLCAALVAVAVLLAARRDVGRGLWPEHRGHARARASLLSPAGLVWRLQRGALMGWAIGLCGFGLVFGGLTEQIQDVEGSALEWYTSRGGTDVIVDAYQVSIVQLGGMAVAIFVVQLLLRLRVDESGGTAESLLATAVDRTAWVVGHVVIAVLGSLALLMVFVASMAITAGRVLGDTAAQLRALVGAGLVQLPVVLVFGAIVVAAVGLKPRWAVAVSWGALFGALLLGPLFGPSLGLPEWVQNLSPFTLAPKLPAAELAVVPLVVLAATCLALVVVGIVAIRDRDLALPA